MPLALMLSPDDQAVSVITAVLEEMSVTCERPLDGASAAQKLNSHSFDLVLVDCENLPAAKLIFDVCRRAKGTHNPVPIAIVDGRAGLPTAFRLGAELILTKPVAKDQARNTIRTAVGRVKKDEPAHSNSSTEIFNPPASDAVPINAGQDKQAFAEPVAEVAPEEHALAAVASATPQLTSYEDPVPVSSSTKPAVASPSLTSAQSVPTATLEIEKPMAAPAVAAVSAEPPRTAPTKLSDDPVLADLERSETETKADIAPPVLFPYSQAKPKKERRAANEDAQASKSRGPLVAVFALVLLGGGLYAAWMYEPGFKDLAQPQVDRVLAMVGMARPQQAEAPTPVGQPVPAPAKIVPATSTDSAQASQSGAANASDAAKASATDSAASTATSSAAATPASAASAPAANTAAETTATPAGKPNKIEVAATTEKGTLQNAVGVSRAETKSTAPVAPVDAELPGEKNTVILSSKGADKRLIHSVQPTYPAGVNPIDVQGTLVLKAVIDENGNVAGARMIEGNSVLAHAAIAAVKQWRYRPYVRDGKALPFQTIVLVDFQRR